MSIFGRKGKHKEPPAAVSEGQVAELLAQRDIPLLTRTLVASESFTDHDKAVRRAAAMALATLDGPEAVDALAEAMDRGGQDAMHSSAEALRLLRAPEAHERMLSLLRDPSQFGSCGLTSTSVTRLLEAVLERGGDPALDLVEYALQREDCVNTSIIAMRALGDYGDERSLNVLREGLEHPSHEVRDAAVDALAKRGEEAFVRLATGSEEVRALIAQLDADIGSGSPYFLPYLEWRRGGPPPDLYHTTYNAEAVLRSARAVAALVALGEQSVRPLRAELDHTSYAYEALGWLGGEDALRDLMRLVDDDDPRKAWAAVRALGYVHDPRVSALLERRDEQRRGHHGGIFHYSPFRLPEVVTALTMARARLAEAEARHGDEVFESVDERIAKVDLAGAADAAADQARDLFAYPQPGDDAVMVHFLLRLCAAQQDGDAASVERLEAVAVAIGHELRRRGGAEEVDRMLAVLAFRDTRDSLRGLLLKGPIPSVATPLGAALVCAACGTLVLSTEGFVAAAAEAGFAVDPLTGDATSMFSGVVGGIEQLRETEVERQRRYDRIEAQRGYACQACGRVHCTACLMSAPPHPSTGGPRCPGCSQGPHAVLH